MREHRQAEQQIQGSFTKEREVASKVVADTKQKRPKPSTRLRRGEAEAGKLLQGRGWNS